MEISELSEGQINGSETIHGSLYLSGLTSIPEGFNPTVGGALDLNGLTSIPEGFNPTVGGYLYLDGLTSIPEGFNPTVGGDLWLNGLTSIPEGFNPTVGGYLDLNGLTSIPEGFNPTVGGDLWLNGLTSIPEGFNPTVGGYLDLRGLTSIPEGFNPTVGGYLYLRGLKAETKECPALITWQDGKYCKADGLFTEVVSSRQAGDRTVLKVKKLNQSKTFYLLVADGICSHGDTLKDAALDLQFKKNEKAPDQYKSLNLESVLSFDDAVMCYRVITGACRFGVSEFLKSLDSLRDEYRISEVIQLTQGQYGSEVFEEFFTQDVPTVPGKG